MSCLESEGQSLARCVDGRVAARARDDDHAWLRERYVVPRYLERSMISALLLLSLFHGHGRHQADAQVRFFGAAEAGGQGREPEMALVE